MRVVLAALVALALTGCGSPVPILDDDEFVIQPYPAPPTATPAPTGGYFDPPQDVPYQEIYTYGDFSRAATLLVAEDLITSADFSTVEIFNPAVSPCIISEDWTYDPSIADTRTLLDSLVGGGTLTVQGMFSGGPLVTMIVTGWQGEPDMPTRPEPPRLGDRETFYHLPTEPLEDINTVAIEVGLMDVAGNFYLSRVQLCTDYYDAVRSLERRGQDLYYVRRP